MILELHLDFVRIFSHFIFTDSGRYRMKGGIFLHGSSNGLLCGVIPQSLPLSPGSHMSWIQCKRTWLVSPTRLFLHPGEMGSFSLPFTGGKLRFSSISISIALGTLL